MAPVIDFRLDPASSYHILTLAQKGRHLLCRDIDGLGILLLQVMVSLAVMAFFWRDHRGLNVWQRFVAPALGMAGLSVCLTLMAVNLDLVSGSTSLVVQSFPVLLLAIGLAGAGLALRRTEIVPT